MSYKKLISVLLTFVLCMSLVPTTAFATTTTPENNTLTSTIYVTTDADACVRVVDTIDTVVSDEVDVIAGKRAEIATLEVGTYTLEYQSLGGGISLIPLRLKF